MKFSSIEKLITAVENNEVENCDVMQWGNDTLLVWTTKAGHYGVEMPSVEDAEHICTMIAEGRTDIVLADLVEMCS